EFRRVLFRSKRAGAAEAWHMQSQCAETLRQIACRIAAQEGEGNTFRTGPAQRHKTMRDLFVAAAEMLRQALEVVAPALGGGEEALIGKQQRASGVAGEGAPGQDARRVGGYESRIRRR